MAQILAFGDSITDGAYDDQGGWATRMHAYLMAENTKIDVVNEESHWFYNLGVSADTAERVLARVKVEAIARKLSRPDKDGVIIFAIGLNDSLAGAPAGNFMFSEEEFRENLRRLAEFACARTSHVIFVGLTPVIERLTTPIYGDCWYTNARIGLFDAIVKQVAVEYRAEFVDILGPMSALAGLDGYFIDGLHPNTAGHAWMFDHIKPVIVRLLAGKPRRMKATGLPRGSA